MGFTGPRNEVKALNLPISRRGGLPAVEGTLALEQTRWIRLQSSDHKASETEKPDAHSKLKLLAAGLAPDFLQERTEPLGRKFVAEAAVEDAGYDGDGGGDDAAAYE